MSRLPQCVHFRAQLRWALLTFPSHLFPVLTVHSSMFAQFASSSHSFTFVLAACFHTNILLLVATLYHSIWQPVLAKSAATPHVTLACWTSGGITWMSTDQTIAVKACFNCNQRFHWHHEPNLIAAWPTWTSQCLEHCSSLDHSSFSPSSSPGIEVEIHWWVWIISYSLSYHQLMLICGVSSWTRSLP